MNCAFLYGHGFDVGSRIACVVGLISGIPFHMYMFWKFVIIAKGLRPEFPVVMLQIH